MTQSSVLRRARSGRKAASLQTVYLLVLLVLTVRANPMTTDGKPSDDRRVLGRQRVTVEPTRTSEALAPAMSLLVFGCEEN